MLTVAVGALAFAPGLAPSFPARHGGVVMSARDTFAFGGADTHGHDQTAIGFLGGRGDGKTTEPAALAPKFFTPEDEFRFGSRRLAVGYKGGTQLAFDAALRSSINQAPLSMTAPAAELEASPSTPEVAEEERAAAVEVAAPLPAFASTQDEFRFGSRRVSVGYEGGTKLAFDAGLRSSLNQAPLSMAAPAAAPLAIEASEPVNKGTRVEPDTQDAVAA